MKLEFRRQAKRSLTILGIAIGLSLVAPVSAQTRTGGSGSGTGLSGGSGGSGSGFTGGSGSSGSGFTGGSGGTSFSGGSGGTSFSGQSTTGQMGTTGRTGGTGSTQSLSQTNFLTATYANPLYAGRPGAQTGLNVAPGGFGQPSLGQVSTTGGTSALGGLGATGLGGQAGRTGGMNALGGQSLNQNTQYSVPSNTRVAYVAMLRFAAPPIHARPQFQTDVRSVIERSSTLSSPGNIEVLAAGSIVTLRGKVPNEDERRLAENLIRLTPGVREIRNELVVE